MLGEDIFLVSDMLSEKDLIKGCKEYNIKAQQELYQRFARKMTAVCYYYTGSSDDAKDLLHEGFIKVFDRFKQYKEEGSLEGWIRRIMVNTAIDFLNTKKKYSNLTADYLKDEDSFVEASLSTEEKTESFGDFTQDEILAVIQALPDEYRLVFNMACIEHYSHKEIAALLNIKEDNSRSRLRKARILLRKQLEALSKEKLKTR